MSTIPFAKFFKQVTPLLVVSIILALSTNSGHADKVDDFIHSKMAELNIPGLQLAIVQNSEIVKTGNYGVANIQHVVPVNENTTFGIYSITKSFVGVTMVQLAEQGKVDLSAPISTYLDDLPKPWQEVKVNQLLSHSSGIPDLLDFSTPGSVLTENVLVTTISSDAIFERTKKKPMMFAVGEKDSYNQTNYFLLDKIIENVTGQPFSLYIINHQLQLLEMPNTIRASFKDSRHVINNSANMYVIDNNGELKNEYYEVPPFAYAAGGMSSTATELARWIIALQSGSLFNQETSLRTLWTTPHLNNGTRSTFALGWSPIKRLEYPAVSSNGGNRAAVIIYRQSGSAVVILTNLKGSFPSDFIEEVANSYFFN